VRTPGVFQVANLARNVAGIDVSAAPPQCQWRRPRLSIAGVVLDGSVIL
jgi:hypothetical protein